VKVAIIPARGGSKRIPRKNIKLFCGKPMIAWAIDAARKSGLFGHIIVSTEDREIAELSAQWGAEIPFIRPENLADDLTPTVPVVAHAVSHCISLGWDIDYACCIYPCSPLLRINDLVEVLDLVREQDVDFAYPVAEYAHPVQRAMRRLPGGKMQFIMPEFELMRTQDLEKSYHDAGQFYWGKASAWREQRKMHTGGLGLPIPNWRVVDIDSMEDWKRAEMIFQLLKQEST
jgi:pseudaminic acid cytidylyltransferase